MANERTPPRVVGIIGTALFVDDLARSLYRESSNSAGRARDVQTGSSRR